MIYYNSYNYPIFDPEGDIDYEFGFIHDNYINPVFIINISKVFEFMQSTGMSTQECVDYFQVKDCAPCRVDRRY